MTNSALPAFGEADLSNCEREQIHLAGSIQPHGVLLLLDDAGTIVLQASGNAGAFFNVAGDVVGLRLANLPGNLAKRLQASLDAPHGRQAVALRARIGDLAVAVDALIHRPPDGGIVVEIERAGPSVRAHDEIQTATQHIVAAASLDALGIETTAIVKRLTGFDRVMLYRFDELGHGEVLAESREEGLDAFANRYAPSDIPEIVRRSYLQNRMELLVDVDDAPVPLVPRLCPLTGRDLDMSMCSLRPGSPIHLQYLRSKGVRATLVLSIVVGGALWGLIACHHCGAKFVAIESRALCDIVAELVATRIAAIESAGQTRAELSIRRLEATMMGAMGGHGEWQTALVDSSDDLLLALRATGAALIYENTVRNVGSAPAIALIRQGAAWLDGLPGEGVIATASIGRDVPGFGQSLSVAAGLAATSISATPGEYLIWFRPERTTTVTRSGDPTKPVYGTAPHEQELVEGASDPWTRVDLITAKLIGETISNLVLRSRCIALLIAQGQPDALSHQLCGSRQKVLVADASGRIIVTSEAVADLLQPGEALPQGLDDLPRLFAGSLKLIRHVDDLTDSDRPFCDGAVVSHPGKASRPIAIRGDPVFAVDGRKLGYIVNIDEVADRVAADTARALFEDEISNARVQREKCLDLHGDRDFAATYAKIVENARLAVIEITYGAEVEGMTHMLASVRASLARTAELLEDLIWHASGVDGEPQ